MSKPTSAPQYNLIQNEIKNGSAQDINKFGYYIKQIRQIDNTRFSVDNPNAIALELVYIPGQNVPELDKILLEISPKRIFVLIYPEFETGNPLKNFENILNVTIDDTGTINTANSLIPVRTLIVQKIRTNFIEKLDQLVTDMVVCDHLKDTLVKNLIAANKLGVSSNSLLNKSSKPDASRQKVVGDIIRDIEFLELKPSDLI